MNFRNSQDVKRFKNPKQNPPVFSKLGRPNYRIDLGNQPDTSRPSYNRNNKRVASSKERGSRTRNKGLKSAEKKLVDLRILTRRKWSQPQKASKISHYEDPDGTEERENALDKTSSVVEKAKTLEAEDNPLFKWKNGRTSSSQKQKTPSPPEEETDHQASQEDDIKMISKETIKLNIRTPESEPIITKKSNSKPYINEVRN